MLDSSRDSNGKVQIRRNDFARLPDLQVRRAVTGVTGGTTRADRRSEHVGQRVENFAPKVCAENG